MFDRLIKLIGKNNLDKIGNAKILLVGVGGVGGFVLEGLVRSGIKNITIVDGDMVDESNLNRQIISNQENIGNNKVDEAIKRCKNINKDINIVGYNVMLNESNIDSLGYFDYIIDACDDIRAKVGLIKYAKDNNMKIICALGTGKRISPCNVKITRLDKTINDPLAKKLRSILKKENINRNIPVVYSEDLPLNHDKTIASCIFVPGVAGLYMAYYVINDIIKDSM